MKETIVITGTSRGLGYELANYLVLNSYNVIGLSRKKGRASSFDSYKNFKFYRCDLSNISSIFKITQKISKEYKAIDVLINNSAKFSMSADKNISDKKLVDIFQTNVIGTIILTRNIIKFNDKSLKKIFNILSVSGLSAQLNQAIYSSTKHALKGYFDSLMQENINKRNIINFYPGGIKTELWDGIKINKNTVKKFMSPKHVAEYILKHLDMPDDIHIKEITFFPKNDWH